MPGYEVMALIKRMAKPEVAACVKRVGEELMKQGTLLRKVENLGERKLTYKIKDSFGEKQETAHYVLYYVNLHRDDTEKLRGVLDRDQDVIKFGYHMDDAFDKKPDFSCVDPMWHQDSPFERY